MKPLQKFEPLQRLICMRGDGDGIAPDEPSRPHDVLSAGAYSPAFISNLRQHITRQTHIFNGLSHINEFAPRPHDLHLKEPREASAPCSSHSIATVRPHPKLIRGCDALVDRLVPTRAHITYRAEKVTELCMLLHQALVSFGVSSDVEFYLFGSVHLRTVLPDGDNDVTIIIADNDADSRAQHADYLPQLRTYLEEHPEYRDYVHVAALVFAEVRLLKLVYCGMNIDITIGQRGGRSTAQFLHAVDQLFGARHLFKRSLLLLKAWCNYEAHILGAQGGYLGTYALSVMLIAVMNEFPRRMLEESPPSPMEVVTKFLQHYATVDFTRDCVTAFGLVPRHGSVSFPGSDTVDRAITEQALLQMIIDFLPPGSGSPLMPINNEAAAGPSITTESDVLSQTSASNASTPRTSTPVPFGAASESHPSPVLGSGFPLRHMNVLDPLRPGMNLCRGISRSHTLRIQSAFKEGYRRIASSSEDVAVGRVGASVAVSFLFEGTEDALRTSKVPLGDIDGGLRHGAAPSFATCTSCVGEVPSPFCVDPERTAMPVLVCHGKYHLPTAQIQPVSVQRPNPAVKAPFVSHTQASRSPPPQPVQPMRRDDQRRPRPNNAFAFVSGATPPRHHHRASHLDSHGGRPPFRDLSLDRFPTLPADGSPT